MKRFLNGDIWEVDEYLLVGLGFVGVVLDFNFFQKVKVLMVREFGRVVFLIKFYSCLQLVLKGYIED